jgi:hypothetical protein
VKPVIGIGAWLPIPGMPVIAISARVVAAITASLKRSSIFVGAATVALAVGLEDTSLV